MRNFKDEEAIYEHISYCLRQNPNFALGSLMKDYDYEKDGTIKGEHLKLILTKGTEGMAEADIDFLIEHISEEGKGKIKSKDFLDNINDFADDEQPLQELTTHMKGRFF
jgi:Ca2+-binding EF-hand superfamily protein